MRSLTAILLVCAAACASEPTRVRQPPLPIAIGIEHGSTLPTTSECGPAAIAAWVLEGYPGVEGPSLEPRRLARGIWPEGSVIWSGDVMRGGAPYLRGRLEPAELDALLGRIRGHAEAARERFDTSITPMHATTLFLVVHAPDLRINLSQELARTPDPARDDPRFDALWSSIWREGLAVVPRDGGDAVEPRLTYVHIEE